MVSVNLGNHLDVILIQEFVAWYIALDTSPFSSHCNIVL